jgi:hypothetical protein
MRLRVVIVAALSLGACARPIGLHLTTSDMRAADASATLLSGKAAAEPDRCETPCTMLIAPGTIHEVVLRARGCFPVRLKVSYDAVASARRVQKNDTPRLVVPMAVRSTSVAPAIPAVVPAISDETAMPDRAEDRLRNLGSLHEKGLISDREFQERRRQILDDELGR